MYDIIVMRIEMLDIIIQQEPQGIINVIKEIFTFASNAAVTIITLYTAWLRFFRKRIDIISLGMSFNRHLGDVVSFAIENKTLSNFTIHSVDVVLESKYIMQIKKFNEPFVIEPFKAYQIVSEGITDSQPIKVSELNSMINTQNCYCIVQTSKGPINSYFRGNKHLVKFKKKQDYIRITLSRNYFNNKALNKDTKFALSVLCESGNYKDILIDNYGFMSEDLFGFNQLPMDTVMDFQTCYDFFKEIGIARGMTFYLYNVALGENRFYRKFVPSQNNV